VNVARNNLVLAAGVLLVAAAVHATSIVPPENLGELARSSDAVVLAVAGVSHTEPRGPLLFTRTTFRVVQAVAGLLEVRERITVEAPGGELDGIGWLVPGSPRFEQGQVYLLFLSEKPTGEWLPRMMAYGLLRRVTGRDGSPLLAPLPEEAGIQPFLREDGILPEPIETYRETALLAHLRAVARGTEAWNSRKVRARSEQVPMEVFAQAIPAGCAFMSGGGYNLRWQRFDSGLTVTMSADSTGDSSISGGGFTQVQGALSDWMGIPSTSLNLVYGGPLSYTMTCTADQDFPAYGTNIVMFNDPCNDITDLNPPCSGTLGYGGPWYSDTNTLSTDGTTWTTIVGWFVVLNNGVGCLVPSNYQIMLAHELGHGLGFNHVTLYPSLMAENCCTPIQSIDRTCAQYVYPSGAPPGPTPTPTVTRTPTPTPTPPTSPPAAPTGVSASDGTWSDRVRILWNASAGATSYHVYRNTTNDSGTAADSGPVTSTSIDDISAVAGTTYWYWVKAFNALGGSPFSSPDTGYRSTTPVPTPTPTPIGPTPTATPTLPPAPPPAPTGVSATDGTFTDRVRITWNAAAAATSYHVYRNTTNDSGSALSLASVTSTSYDDSGASGTQVYWYWVRAFNAVGGSPYSASDSGYRAGAGPTPTPIPPPTPTPPTGLAASFTFSPTTPTQGQQVQFTDTSSGATAWSWTFGDGSQSSVRNPSHTYAVRGTYTVTLRVTNGVGSSQTTKTITVGARARRNFSGR
jgi:hypothetical protein